MVLGNGWVFDIRPGDFLPNQTTHFQNPENDFQVWIDRETLNKSALLRTRKKGDVFSPLGMGGKSMKISDLMINEKIPMKYRERWPLLVSRNQILWVPGVRLSHEARITLETKSVVKLSFIRKES